MELSQYLECAMAVNTHGVKGTLRLENRCDSPKTLAQLKTMYINKNGEYCPIKVVHSSVQKNMVLTTFEGIDTLEAAIALKNTVFFADRTDFKLRRGDYFIADLIGLPVYDIDNNELLGKLSDVIFPGAQQVYIIESEKGDFMVPNVPEFVREISLEGNGKIYIHLIEGMREKEENEN